MEGKVLLDIELSLVDPITKSRPIAGNLPDDVKALVSLMQTGKYVQVLNANQEWMLEHTPAEGCFQDAVERAINRFWEGNNSSEASLLQVFFVGVSCLQTFVQANWLGLPHQDAQATVRRMALKEGSLRRLVLDGECFFPTVRELPLLAVARTILHDLRHRFAAFKLANWWLLRYLYVHQRVLEESSPTLNSVLVQTVESLPEMERLLVDDQLAPLASSLHLEIGYAYLLYGEIQKGKHHFERANEISKFSLEWTGALGRRTKFQQNALPQLTVRVFSQGIAQEDSSDYAPPDDLPRDVKLDDDTRLHQIAFLDRDDNVLPNLPPIHQALVIAAATQREKFNAQDELLAEEVAPLVNCVLGHPKVWTLQLSALLIRSKMESNQRRAVERSMTQLQELVDALGKTSSLAKRIDCFYVSRMPLESELQGALAGVFLALGSVNSALDMYLRLQMWEEVIGCYQHLDMKHKAEEIVRQELAKGETPKLWCLLGQCTDDVACFEKAWELSGHKSARAQRDWAYYHYRKKQYRECIPHFQSSLQVNSLQEGIWLRLAFSAMQVEEWETASGAYRRYCALNSESFEAWNNVAKCYVKLGQKARAWRALQEAVKCQYENWKVWDNLMVVSVDCCEYEEVMRAYHRILDLKEKHTDCQVLRILVTAVAENRADNYGEPIARLAASLHKLLGRLTAQVVNNAELWDMYADLVAASEPQEAFRVAQLRQKAVRSAVQEKNWERDVGTCNSTLKTCGKFVESCMHLLNASRCSENVQLASSGRLSLRSAIAQVKLYYPVEIPDEIKTSLTQLESLHCDLLAKLSVPT